MHKKLLSVLLALVMILSVLPMAAFAEETEHTHDENCGCVMPLAACTHPVYTPIGTTYGYEADELDGYHLYCTYAVRQCGSCGVTFNIKTSSIRQGHNSEVSKTCIGEEMIDGELYYVYECVCSCNAYWILYSSFPPSGTV